MTLTIQDAATAWLAHLQTRRRRPIKISSAKTFESYISKWIEPHLGHLAVGEVGVKVMRDFISVLNAAKLSAKSQVEISGIVKAIVASVCNEEGEPLYPRMWSSEKLDLPIISGQHQPTVSSSEVEAAITASDAATGVLIALAASSGARVGELRSLRVTPSDSAVSHWNQSAGTLEIRTSMWNDIEQSPKTFNAVRTIELAAPVNDMLRVFIGTRSGFVFGNGEPASVSTLRSHLDEVLPSKGFHSLRRFRVTHLAERNCPREIARYWTGHAKGDVHETYNHLSENLALRRKLADEIGIGFRLTEKAS